jgi:putative membrane protein
VYIDSQVTEHQKVLDTVDQQLLPSAQSPEVRDALQKAREKVAAHLEEAKRLQTELAKQGAK